MLRILGKSNQVAAENPLAAGRRSLLQAAGAGLFGLSLPKLFAAEDLQAAKHIPGSGKAKAVIFLTLFGGPSQLETFDLKPNAPTKIRGPFAPLPAKPLAC